MKNSVQVAFSEAAKLFKVMCITQILHFTIWAFADTERL